MSRSRGCSIGLCDFDLGFETAVWATYAYSDVVTFEAGWSHFFCGGGMDRGAFVDMNGLALLRGRDTKGADNLYFGTSISF